MEQRVRSYDPLQPNYAYRIDPEANYHPDFQPDLSPAQVLMLGAFGCGYFERHRRFTKEFPHLPDVCSNSHPDPEHNYFNVQASMSRREWERRGWMHKDDPRGWFQWYCRYDMGRRHADDERQIKRWNNFKTRKLRAIGGDTNLNNHLATRQGLLHWGILTPGHPLEV